MMVVEGSGLGTLMRWLGGRCPGVQVSAPAWAPAWAKAVAGPEIGCLNGDAHRLGTRLVINYCTGAGESARRGPML